MKRFFQKKGMEFKSIVKAVKGKMKVGASLLKKLNPKNLYKSFKDKMKDVCLFGKCFTGDTLVYTEKGYVPICEIKVGDIVLSRDEATGETGYKKVDQIYITETYTIHSIEVDGSTVIKTTAYHPFYVEGQGWVSAISLKEGDCLITPDGVLCITNVGKERYEEPVSMYNFHVEDRVSYFVTELNIYVHNGFGHLDNYPKTRQEIHYDLINKGYKTNGPSGVKGNVVYKGADGKQVVIKDTGEVITTQKVKIDSNDSAWNAKKYPQRQYYDGTVIPDGSHSTDQFVETLDSAGFVPPNNIE